VLKSYDSQLTREQLIEKIPTSNSRRLQRETPASQEGRKELADPPKSYEFRQGGSGNN